MFKTNTKSHRHPSIRFLSKSKTQLVNQRKQKVDMSVKGAPRGNDTTTTDQITAEPSAYFMSALFLTNVQMRCAILSRDIV